MKITSIECLISSDETGSNLVYVRTNTDAGIHGVGEVYHVGPDRASVDWIEYFAEQLVGQDSTEIERNWALCYQGARFPIGSSGLAALSAIDQSLWDITGKALDKPVYALLGGRVRDKIRAYFLRLFNCGKIGPSRRGTVRNYDESSLVSQKFFGDSNHLFHSCRRIVPRQCSAFSSSC